MTEDLSYNLTNIKNFSLVSKLNNKPGMSYSLFSLFQVSLTYDMSLNENDLETISYFDISMNNDNFVNLDILLQENKFTTFYSYLNFKIDTNIDKVYEKFKRIIEISPSIILRSRRNRKIEKTDFIMLEDFELDETEKEKWKEYRKQLRDMTKNIQNDEIILYEDNTFNIEWPTIPNVNLLLINNYYNYD